MIRPAVLLAATLALSACGSSTATVPQQHGGIMLQVNTDSPIAGATLRCAGDYPDSRLVFAPDGSVGGRFAGHDVTGHWNARAPDQVDVLVQAGGISVRDTMRRTAAGWRGDTTACD